MKSLRNLRRVCCAVTAALCIAESAPAAAVVYQTGFQTPGFNTGNLAGQGGWASSISVSSNSAKIVAAAGGQELQISGSLVGLYSAGNYECFFARTLGNYAPMSSGTPIVDISASAWQQLGTAAGAANVFFSVYDQNGKIYGSMAINHSGQVFAQNYNSPNALVDAGTTATNSFHNLNLELNFTNHTMSLFEDGLAIGSIAFNTNASNQLGSLAIVAQNANPIDSTLWVTNVSVTAGTVPTPAGCELVITSAATCLPGGSNGIPNVGDPYYEVSVYANVIGTPSQPFRLRWTMAGVTNYSGYYNLGAGNGYRWFLPNALPLDGPIPWSVTLDPDGVSGNANPAGATTNGTFTPVPPTNIVELYDTRTMHGFEGYALSFAGGTINNLEVLFGVPTSHGAQTAVSVTIPADGRIVATPPYGVPLAVTARTNVAPGVYGDTNYFTVQLSNMRVNPGLLRSNTWADLTAMTTNWTQWLAPDPMDQWTNPVIRAFVQQSLPSNYQSVLTPYDTARMLHQAVEKRLSYQTPLTFWDAVAVLTNDVGDCGGYAHLLTACLRSVGIPARMITGFWEGDTNVHCRTEFHLPNTEWVLADACLGGLLDQSGNYAYYFGFVPDGNQYLAVDTGDAHTLPYGTFTFIELPTYWWSQGPTSSSYTWATYLQPNGVLSLTNVSRSSLQLSLTDVASEGTVKLQSSSDLVNWTTVASNAAAGTNILYSYPVSGSGNQFYRANVSP